MYNSAKRYLDIIMATAIMICLTPISLLATIAILCKMGRPILFSQTRAGLHGAPFRMFKFRTMTNKRDKNGVLLKDAQRITPLGRLLRRTSIDELPQLWNVIKGDMSIVGPRPLFMEYMPYYTEREQKRHEVRPGITGLAQVTGRNVLLWDERLELDVRYVEQISFKLDCHIIVQTIIKVLRRSDIVDIPSNQQGTLVACRTHGYKEVTWRG